MEFSRLHQYIKIAKVSNVVLHRRGTATQGTLHLTTHHLIFESPQLSTEFWFPYPLIYGVHKNPGSTLLSKPPTAYSLSLSLIGEKCYNLRVLVTLLHISINQRSIIIRKI
uniref:MTMR6-9 GRAM domain-containing protein n=1 Tax=Marmota marmota marmota TaxID=9994 RepID=A0A8C5Z861_MARMA